MRKLGKVMTTKELDQLPKADLIKRMRKFIRTDWGGSKEPANVALTRACKLSSSFGELINSMNSKDREVIGNALILIAQDACESSRHRLLSTERAMVRRFLSPLERYDFVKKNRELGKILNNRKK